MSNTVLCATDGLEHSKIAVAYAAELAKCNRSSLVLLTINVVIGSRAPFTSREDAELEKILDEATSIAEDAGVPDVSRVIVRSRDAAWAIVQYAENNSVDHIVLGTGDKGAVSRMLIGSVARDVVARAHCPVTVAR